jgi:hypothetical protein
MSNFRYLEFEYCLDGELEFEKLVYSKKVKYSYDLFCDLTMVVTMLHMSPIYKFF